MKKVFVYSFFGLGDCIRFSPLFKGIQEELGEPCHFEFTSSTLPLQNLFDAQRVSIFPMNLHKKYDAVLNFIAGGEVPQLDAERAIWRGFLGDNVEFKTSHVQPSEEFKVFNRKFLQTDRNSLELARLCKEYAPLLPGSSVERYAGFMGIKPSSFEYLYQVSEEERSQAEQYLSPGKKTICFAPTATAQIRCLSDERIRQIYSLIIDENVLLLVSEEEGKRFEDIPQIHDLRVAAAVCERADLVISVDSYFSHVSYALGRPTVALFAYAPGFALPPVPKGPIEVLEHPTEGADSIPLEQIQEAIEKLL